MFRIALSTSLLAGAFLLGVSSTATSSQAPAMGIAGASISNSPLLIYSVEGGTLAGLYHTQIAVYSGGLVTVAKKNEVVWPSPGTDEGVGMAYLTTEELSALMNKLAQANAFHLEDQDMTVTDVPLTTMTVLRGGDDSRAHSFSYWLPIEEYAGAAHAVEDLLDTHFPEL